MENLLAAVDRQIASIQAEVQVLAVSPSLQSGDFAAFDRQMRAALKIRGTSIVLHDIKAQQLLSSNRPFGEPLPRATTAAFAKGRPCKFTCRERLRRQHRDQDDRRRSNQPEKRTFS